MNMFTYHLDRSSDTPLYEQLYQYIKHEIVNGRLQYGTQLPSKRMLAEQMKISKNTVETSYEQLIAEGYVKSVDRTGIFVHASEQLKSEQTEDSIPPEAIPKQRKWKYQFHPEKIDTNHFPLDKWRKHANKILIQKNESLLSFGSMQGEYALRKEIANYVYQKRSVISSPDQMIIGAGMEMLLQQLILLFGSNQVYGIENPGYHAMFHVLQHGSHKVQLLDVEPARFNVKQLNDTNVDIVCLTPTHHFPYGSVLSINERIQLLRWSQQAQNRYIIEIDHDSEFRYSGKQISSLQSMDQGGKVIYLGSFSKTLTPSLRINYLILPNQLLSAYREKFSHDQCTVSRIDQHILASFMKSGEFQRHINRMRTLYRKKRNVVRAVLKPYEDQIQIIGAQSGLHVVLDMNNGMTEAELVQSAADHGLKIYPLSHYVMKPKAQTRAQLILGFAGIPEKELEQTLHMLLKSWNLK